jgi:outer membrane protein OmpA-like peptidoglycan-associated protein/tetratricopeptide (TPR) repeat protein
MRAYPLLTPFDSRLLARTGPQSCLPVYLPEGGRQAQLPRECKPSAFSECFTIHDSRNFLPLGTDIVRLYREGTIHMKKIIIILSFLLMSVITSMAQDGYTTRSNRAIHHYQKAAQYYRMLEFDQTVVELGHSLEADPEFVEALLLLGQVYSDMGRLEESVTAYKNAIENNPSFYPNAFYFLAENEYLTAAYDDALEHFETFLSIGRGSARYMRLAFNRLEYCRFSLWAIANPVPFDPINLGKNINSEFDDYWPSLSADELVLVITRLLPIDESNPETYMNRQEDFYVSIFADGEWQPVEDVGAPLNTSNNEGAQSISSDGSFMVFTGCNREDGYGRCDLYYSELRGDKWTVPRNLGGTINTPFGEKQPSLSSDGRILYFVSNRNDGLGGYDVWISYKQDDGSWGSPVNAGDSINTPGDEHSPFIHPDNQTLYFSSDGWPGLGLFDIFITRKTSDSTWSTPVNLGYPINTNGNEEGLIVNAKGQTAYYSSDRSSDQARDIFYFNLYEEVRPIKVSYMKGRVYDVETKQRLGARFELINLNTASPIMVSTSDPETGEFLVCIPANADYALNVSRTGYLFYSDHFETRQVYERTHPFLKDIPLQPIRVGERIILRNVFFEYNKHDLKSESRIELNKVVKLMNDNPTLVVELSGHTDNTGTAEYNQTLSENRALSVRNYLVENGIDEARMTYKGYGLTMPIATNETEEGRATNRRTELKILEK